MHQAELDFTKSIRDRHFHSLTRQNVMYAKILEYLETVADATNREIAKALHVETCSITGRCFELRDRQVVVFAGTRKCKITGNHVSSWRVK